jgi:hypothetical protein
MDRRDRPALDDLAKRPALGIVQLGRGAGRPAVDQTLRTLVVETQNPVTDNLKGDPSSLGRIAALAAVVDHGQRQQASRPSQEPEVGPRCSHRAGELQLTWQTSSSFAIVNHIPS